MINLFISFSAHLIFYINKGFFFYILSSQNRLSATRIHKIRLLTLYREESNELH